MQTFHAEQSELLEYLRERNLEPSILYNNNIYKESFVYCMKILKKMYPENRDMLAIMDGIIECFSAPSGIPGSYLLENKANKEFLPKLLDYAKKINKKEDDLYSEIAEKFANVEFNELDKTLRTQDLKYLTARELTEDSEGMAEALMDFYRYVCRGHLIFSLIQSGDITEEKYEELIGLKNFDHAPFYHHPIMHDISTQFAQKSTLCTALANIARLYHKRISGNVADMADGNVLVGLWKNSGSEAVQSYTEVSKAAALEMLEENDGLALWPILYLIAAEKNGLDLNTAPAKLTEAFFGPVFNAKDQTELLQKAQADHNTEELFETVSEWISDGFPVYVQRNSEDDSWSCIAGAYQITSGERILRLYTPSLDDLEDVNCETLLSSAKKLEINASEELKAIPSTRLIEFDIITEADIESYKAKLITKEMLSSYVKCLFDMYAILLSSYTVLNKESIEFKRLYMHINDATGYIARGYNSPDDIIDKQLKPMVILAGEYAATLDESLPIRIRQRRRVCNAINLLNEAFNSVGEIHNDPFNFYRRSFTKAFSERILRKNEFDTDEVMIEFETDTLLDDKSYLSLLGKINFVYLIDPQPKMLDDMIAKYEAM